MLEFYQLEPQGLIFVEQNLCSLQGEKIVWVDIFNPSEEEISHVENHLNITIPSLQQTQRVEDSNRFYTKNSTLFMTCSIAVKEKVTKLLKTEMVSFILHPKFIITVRYSDIMPFFQFKNRLKIIDLKEVNTVDKIAVSIIETIVDEIGDDLKDIKENLQEMNQKIFCQEQIQLHQAGLKGVIQLIGLEDMKITKLHESIASLSRIINFCAKMPIRLESLPRIRIIESDLKSMKEFAAQLTAELNFLLQANLGFINIEQNKIIKAFTIASVLFLPPTLVGTIYGMNFRNMPELEWSLGYPIAIILMLLSCFVPYLFLKRKTWL